MAFFSFENGFFGKLVSDRKAKRFYKKYGPQLFLVYSMGKVGSSTVKSAFDRSYPFLPCFQVHFLSGEWLHKRLPALSEFFQTPNLKVANEFFDFRKAHPQSRLKIITLVREPVIRNVSDVFENWGGFFGAKTIEEVGADRLLEHLRRHEYEYALTWFDTEFREWTGIDIYNYPFDKERGWSSWSFPDFDLLCIKLEKLNEVLPEATIALAGFPLTIVESANQSEKKPGQAKALYRKVLAEFKVPEELAGAIYDSRYVRHFYSEQEIAAFREKWSEKKDQPVK